MPLRVLIAAGGTGGHIFPGLAVARELQRRDPEVAILFVGTARGLETRVVPGEGFPLELIDVAGLKRVGVTRALRSLAQLPRSLWQARALIRRFRPDVVIGVGGYASGPVMLWAVLSGLPTMVIEPNAYPGFTNRLLARWIRRAAIGFPEAASYFHGKAVVTGNPVRPEFFHIAEQNRPGARTGGAFHLLIVGGSQGAHAINQAVIAVLPPLLEKYRQLTVTHQTGERDWTWARLAYESIEGRERLHVRAFIDHMAEEVARADLIICRAGAMTVAELTAAGKPAILIPLPTAADDHQRKNAEALGRQGAARCLLQSELTPERLMEEISAFLANPHRLTTMAEASRRLARPDAARKIVDLVYELVADGRHAAANQEQPARPDERWMANEKKARNGQQLIADH